jgi:hypothetical protein
MKKENSINPVMQCYDWASKDFKTISDRAGGGYIAADKDHERGEQVLNVLFKNDMLFIYETPALNKLAAELVGLRKETSKTKAKDDFADALRYAVTRIPWDWSAITGAKLVEEEEKKEPLNSMQQQIADRRKQFDDSQKDENASQQIQEEFDEWNSYHGV